MYAFLYTLNTSQGEHPLNNKQHAAGPGPGRIALYLPSSWVWPSTTAFYSTMTLFCFPDKFWPMMADEMCQWQWKTHCGDTKAEPMWEWECRGFRVSQEVTGEMEGKEQWAVTGWWRKTFWRMKGIEGYSIRGRLWKKRSQVERPETSEIGQKVRNTHQCMRLKILTSNLIQHRISEATLPQFTPILPQNSFGLWAG